MKFRVKKEFTISLSESEAVAIWRWMDNTTEPSRTAEAYALWEKLDIQFRGKVLP